MSAHTARLDSGPLEGFRETAREITGYWWTSLVAGIAWIVISAVLLQFDQASVTTVGILVGLLFVFLGVQNLALSRVPREFLDQAGISRAWRWIAALFGVFFLGSAVTSFVSPGNTFAALADTLGFLFLAIGFWWMLRAFLERPVNRLWWLGLISGILMIVLAFWTAGQFFVERAYVLLIFAGIWALMEGITSVVRALEMRELHERL